MEELEAKHTAQHESLLEHLDEEVAKVEEKKAEARRNRLHDAGSYCWQRFAHEKSQHSFKSSKGEPEKDLRGLETSASAQHR